MNEQDPLASGSDLPVDGVFGHPLQHQGLRLRPPVRKMCRRCGVQQDLVERVTVIVSPAGTAHFGTDGGNTDCGIDATGDKWWWPV